MPPAAMGFYPTRSPRKRCRNAGKCGRIPPTIIARARSLWEGACSRQFRIASKLAPTGRKDIRPTSDFRVFGVFRGEPSGLVERLDLKTLRSSADQCSALGSTRSTLGGEGTTKYTNHTKGILRAIALPRDEETLAPTMQFGHGAHGLIPRRNNLTDHRPAESPNREPEFRDLSSVAGLAIRVIRAIRGKFRLLESGGVRTSDFRVFGVFRGDSSGSNLARTGTGVANSAIASRGGARRLGAPR